MNKKKILFLGGAFSQLPAIKYAKEQGHYVITVDYLPDNPGHKISNEYHNISSTNKEQILELAKNLKIDAISAYASDPAATTAAYVSEKMNLVGSPHESVEILSNKNLFREFLIANGFHTPWYICETDKTELKKKYNGEKSIIKPTDSSGSKGIFIINNINDIDQYFEITKSYSRSGKVILEQFIKPKGPQLHGEGFVLNGELIFILLGDQIFSPVNNLVPYSTLVPSLFHTDIMGEAVNTVIKAIKKVGFITGGLNIELIRDNKDNIYILEIGARNGGNFMPQLINYATGFDLVKANIDILFNPDSPLQSFIIPKCYFAQIILHSDKEGIFNGLNIPDEFKNKVLEQNVYYKIGDKINKYQNSKDVIGVIIICLKNNVEQYYKNTHCNNWLKIKYL